MKAKDETIDDFSLDQFDATDTAEMTVVVGGRLTNWKWHFAGPGHPQAITQSNRMARERLQRDRSKEQAQTNGKKWKAPEEDVDEIRDKNVAYVIERLVGWSPVRIDGAMFEFSEANARKLLGDPARVNLLAQAMEFIADDQSFTQRSA